MSTPLEQILDDVPSEYRPAKVNIPLTFGVGGTIQQLYATYLTSEQGHIFIEDNDYVVAPECVAMLKATLFAGCCRIEERAKACRQVFEQCLMSKTPEEFVSKFDESTADVWVQSIYKAIKGVWKV